jgi:UDP-2,3-diacylglucosamine pyrophosphatase LpxH
LRTYSYGPLDVLAQMLDLPMQEEYEFWVGRRKYVVFHGDVFDGTLRMERLSHAADEFYRLVQRCSQPGARWLKMRVKHWGGVVQRVRAGAVQLAKERRCQGVILGHVHFAEDAWVEGVHYLNTGCWVESPCTYVFADEHAISLRTWHDASVHKPAADLAPLNLEPASVPSRALAAAAT